jgi:predicted metal-binding membrane protein
VGRVIASAPDRPAGRVPALTGARAHLGLVALLFALAALGWWSTADRMRGMDDGPWTALGALGWFLGVWVVMMAAMMFPSLAPTVALYARMARDRLAPLLFTAGYLVVWGAAGVTAFAIAWGGRDIAGDVLAWDRAGRWVAGATLLVAAAYELTPLKRVCLAKCRSPLGFLLGAWRDGRAGSLQMGVRHGAWCVGCCWALMAALFALGVMSIAWMAFVAALIAAEKTLPWGRTVTYGTAAILFALGVLIVAAPDAIPGLTIPDDGSTGDMAPMPGMASGYAAASDLTVSRAGLRPSTWRQGILAGSSVRCSGGSAASTARRDSSTATFASAVPRQ